MSTSTRLSAGCWTLAIAVVGLALIVVGRAATAQQTCPDCNVIVIALDTLRADHLGAYGYARNTSPNIDAFAKEARVFTNFYSNSSWTVPTFAAMFTSQYPSDVKMQLPADKLDDRFTTIAEVFKANGYATVGFNSPTPVSRNGGYFQGFDSFTVVQPGREVRDTTLLVPQALEWLDANRGKKFFMFLHTFEVHDPWCPPAEFDRFAGGEANAALDCVDIVAVSKHNREEARFSAQDLTRVVSLYDADLLHADDNLGRLFERLRAGGLYRNTIVVLVADHGEELGERDMVGHAYSLSHELVHVPLIIKAPNLAAGIEPSSGATIDIAPTLLDLVGIAKPPAFKGSSLRNLEPNRVIYQETSAPVELVRQLDLIIAAGQAQPAPNAVRQDVVLPLKEAVIQSNWKYTVDRATNGRALYNLAEDPRERRNLMGTNRPQEAALRDAYLSLRRQ